MRWIWGRIASLIWLVMASRIRSRKYGTLGIRSRKRRKMSRRRRNKKQKNKSVDKDREKEEKNGFPLCELQVIILLVRCFLMVKHHIKIAEEVVIY